MKSVYARSASNWPETKAVAQLDVIGSKPKYLPYLRIELSGTDVSNVAGAAIYTVESVPTLRRLALGILKALGEEPGRATKGDG